ncbi:MAG TPA: hypothetical protein VM238_19480 [Phycisphaerae bacterium]|nr:hypothetical protein [Phycisphaerae bacterium]
MTRFACLAAASVVMALACGCTRQSLSAYEPAGPGADNRTLQSVSLEYLSRYFVHGGPPGEEQLRDATDPFMQNLDRAFVARPVYPGFRSLCALVNRHFGHWDRLVIIERISFGGGGYGFIVVARTSRDLVAVTNLELSERDTWYSERNRLRELTPDRQAFEACSAEIDEAGGVLPEVLLWFSNVDWPVYVLHNIRPDGKAFSFAVSGYIAGKDPGVNAPKRADEFAAGARLLREVRPRWFVSDATPEASKLRMAGGVYARLLARVWRSTLGEPDDCILGEAEKSVSPDSPSEHSQQ